MSSTVNKEKEAENGPVKNFHLEFLNVTGRFGLKL